MFSLPLRIAIIILVCGSFCLALDEFAVTVAQKPKYTIYEKDGVLFCSGDTQVAVQNNKGAEKLVINDLDSAIEIFKEGLQHAPLFYPFLYNIGIAFMRKREYDAAHVYFEKAMHVVPENPKIYILMGELYALTGREGDGLILFRKALQINRKELVAIIKIGNIYVDRNQLELAQRYYDAALKINPQYPDAVIGFAKIHFKKGEYYKALVWLKSIDVAKTQYDKAYHYYFAESSFKLKDYKTAYEQYAKLLQYKDDVFFLSHSYALIEHKMNLSRQFAELEME
ncbi:MAG: tetratricopeptide repeat protein [Spirochaetes bacterium]|nr:tetratricopeptide repeat protein [Spirochaetota bacterium]